MLSGLLAEADGVRAAIWAVAGLTAGSGALAAVRVYETCVPTPVEPLSGTGVVPFPGG